MGSTLYVRVCSVGQEVYFWRGGPASLVGVGHRLSHCPQSYLGSPVFLNILLRFCFPLVNVLTADVPRASVNPDAFFVSTVDHNIVEAQFHASHVLSVPRSLQVAPTRRSGMRGWHDKSPEREWNGRWARKKKTETEALNRPRAIEQWIFI